MSLLHTIQWEAVTPTLLSELGIDTDADALKTSVAFAEAALEAERKCIMTITLNHFIQPGTEMRIWGIDPTPDGIYRATEINVDHRGDCVATIEYVRPLPDTDTSEQGSVA